MKVGEYSMDEIVFNVFKAACNNVRLKILFKMEEEKLTYSEIKELTGLSGTGITFHMDILLQAKLVERTTERGPYRITEMGHVTLRALIHMQNKIRRLERSGLVEVGV